MGRVFETRIRKIGTSAGVLIPKDVLEGQKLRVGDTIEVGILLPKRERIRILKKAAGSAKGASPFKRDKRDWRF